MLDLALADLGVASLEPNAIASLARFDLDFGIASLKKLVAIEDVDASARRLDVDLIAADGRWRCHEHRRETKQSDDGDFTC